VREGATLFDRIFIGLYIPLLRDLLRCLAKINLTFQANDDIVDMC